MAQQPVGWNEVTEVGSIRWQSLAGGLYLLNDSLGAWIGLGRRLGSDDVRLLEPERLADKVAVEASIEQVEPLPFVPAI